METAAIFALGIPFAMIGGVYGLTFAGLPLTMPAAIGFVTLGGLSILNGLVLMTCFNQLREQGIGAFEAALQSAKMRLRPVLLKEKLWIPAAHHHDPSRK